MRAGACAALNAPLQAVQPTRTGAPSRSGLFAEPQQRPDATLAGRTRARRLAVHLDARDYCARLCMRWMLLVLAWKS